MLIFEMFWQTSIFCKLFDLTTLKSSVIEDIGRLNVSHQQYQTEVTYSFFRWLLLGVSFAENRKMERIQRKKQLLEDAEDSKWSREARKAKIARDRVFDITKLGGESNDTSDSECEQEEDHRDKTTKSGGSNKRNNTVGG